MMNPHAELVAKKAKADETKPALAVAATNPVASQDMDCNSPSHKNEEGKELSLPRHDAPAKKQQLPVEKKKTKEGAMVPNPVAPQDMDCDGRSRSGEGEELPLPRNDAPNAKSHKKKKTKKEVVDDVDDTTGSVSDLEIKGHKKKQGKVVFVVGYKPTPKGRRGGGRQQGRRVKGKKSRNASKPWDANPEAVYSDSPAMVRDYVGFHPELASAILQQLKEAAQLAFENDAELEAFADIHATQEREAAESAARAEEEETKRMVRSEKAFCLLLTRLSHIAWVFTFADVAVL